jgi:hypothetical protein
MNRRMSIHKLVFASFTVGCVAVTWSGCAAAPDDSNGGGGTTTSTSSSGGGGAGGTGGTGGITVETGGGSMTGGAGGACVSTSEKAERVPLDILFLVDRSGSMAGAKWAGTTSALTDFFNDPASAKIGVGMSLFPGFEASNCVADDYKTLDVPIAVLPANSFALTNSLPADAKGTSTPTYPALQGTLLAATAYQDANPTHKVVVVLATDGDPAGCENNSIDAVADLAQSARSYNGVLTYVIGVAGSTIPNLNKVAVAGGTEAAYDVTSDITQFVAKMAEIRSKALGCEFEIPTPPNSMELNPDEVNFTYTPMGTGMPKLLLRADGLEACGDKPGWYYDNAFDPKKIILCPAACATVQKDSNAKVDVLFGCESQTY